MLSKLFKKISIWLFRKSFRLANNINKLNKERNEK